MSIVIAPRRTAWLKFVMESYEGLALVSTLAPQSGRTQLRIAPGSERDVADLLDSLRGELGVIDGLSQDWRNTPALDRNR